MDVCAPRRDTEQQAANGKLQHVPCGAADDRVEIAVDLRTVLQGNIFQLLLSRRFSR